MTKHPTVAHYVADLHRKALLDETIADRRGVPTTVGRRYLTRPIRWLIARLAAVITRVLEDFEPIPETPAPTDWWDRFPALHEPGVRRGAPR